MSFHTRNGSCGRAITLNLAWSPVVAVNETAKYFSNDFKEREVPPRGGGADTIVTLARAARVNFLYYHEAMPYPWECLDRSLWDHFGRTSVHRRQFYANFVKSPLSPLAP